MIINIEKSITLEDTDITTLKEARAVLEKLSDVVGHDEYIDIYRGEWGGDEIESFLSVLDALCYQKGSTMKIYYKGEQDND